MRVKGVRGKPKKGERAKRRQRRIKRACFEEGPRFSGAKHTETGWADGVFLHHAGRKDFFDTLRQRETAAFSDILGGIVMKLTWLGHACFLLEEDGYRIVLDPYTGVAGYPPLHIQAHAVFCSHGHFDHHATDCVELLPERESPFAVREVETFHDDRGGALRGTNTVRIFTAGGLSAAHLGDLGHQLTAEQAAAIGPVDAVLVPVGGVYTVDAAGAKAVCDALHPRCVVPMHYHHAPYGLTEVDSVEPFLELWPAEEVHHLQGAAFELTEQTAGVMVPSF